MNPVALDFAGWASRLRWDAVPAPVRDRLTLRLADGVGLVAAGWDTPPGRVVRDLAARMSTGGGPATPLLFGGPPVTPAWAALAHGTLVHALDYDDTFPASVVHPTSVLLPAALAAADVAGTAGDRLAADPAGDAGDLLAAVAAGDELLARLGAAAGRDLHARGFQATGVFGPLAAALVVGTRHRRDPATVAAALGLAGSMSGGLLEFLSDGTWSKRLHPGWAAHGGVVADALAAGGFPGPATVVEGRHGLFASFLGRDLGEPGAVTAGLGEAWRSAEAEIKHYPCAHVLHPFIAMARRLRATGQLPAAGITEVVCTVAPWYVPIVCEPAAEKRAPVTEYQARTSLPVAVALALLDDADVAVASFEPASTDRPALRQLADRVRYVADPRLSEGFAGRLTVRTADRELTAEPDGGPDPHPEARVRAKFTAAVGGDGPAAAALWDAARHLDRHGLAHLRRTTTDLARSWHPATP